jgi:hypothetical protein
MKTLSTWVEVEIDLDEFEDEDLIDELESRGYAVSDTPLEANTEEFCIAAVDAFTVSDKRKLFQELKRFVEANSGRIVTIPKEWVDNEI